MQIISMVWQFGECELDEVLGGDDLGVGCSSRVLVDLSSALHVALYYRHVRML